MLSCYPHVRRCYLLFALAVAVAVLASRSAAYAAGQKYWELSPYRVQLHLAVDDSQRPQANLAEQLAAALQKKIRATLYPLWTTETNVAVGPQKQRLLTQLDQLDSLPADDLDPEELALACDKQMFLTLVTTPVGVTLHCREFDCTTHRWGAIQQQHVRQSWMLPTQCFELVCRTFSPLATIRPVENDEKQVRLHFRGNELPQQTDLSFLTSAGEAYQPLMVRTSTAGEVKPDSIREIPWTYLALSERKDGEWHAAVHTGTRRPFGVRRRGRIEHLALALKQPAGSTKVRFYARHDATQSLTGYEVFRREPTANESIPLGQTSTTGVIDVLPGESKVTLLFLRSDGQLLAKVPVVPGAKEKLEVPVADDTSRLRAQAALTSLTEQLIDTVAQRNILIARVKDRLEQGKLEEAQQLFTTLDNLPGRAKFNQRISSVENRKLNQSDDPKVQARIEKLFADTRKLLGKFLNTKQITELQGELSAARRNNAG